MAPQVLGEELKSGQRLIQGSFFEQDITETDPCFQGSLEFPGIALKKDALLVKGKEALHLRFPGGRCSFRENANALFAFITLSAAGARDGA